MKYYIHLSQIYNPPLLDDIPKAFFSVIAEFIRSGRNSIREQLENHLTSGIPQHEKSGAKEEEEGKKSGEEVENEAKKMRLTTPEKGVGGVMKTSVEDTRGVSFSPSSSPTIELVNTSALSSNDGTTQPPALLKDDTSV